MVLTDMPGRKRLRVAWEGATSSSHAIAIVFIVDSADESRFGQARTELHRVAKTSSLPLLVLANKQDLPQAATADEVTKALGCVGAQMPVRGCSAIDDSLCVSAIMAWVAELSVISHASHQRADVQGGRARM